MPVNRYVNRHLSKLAHACQSVFSDGRIGSGRGTRKKGATPASVKARII
jgi:hypothetical protein